VLPTSLSSWAFGFPNLFRLYVPTLPIGWGFQDSALLLQRSPPADSPVLAVL